MKLQVFEMPQVIEEQRKSGSTWLEFFRVPALSMGVYSLSAGAEDPQTPHHEDEIYYVVNGRASIRVEGEERKIGPGSVVFVAAKAKHRFHTITEDLKLLVVFAPAEDLAKPALSN